MNKSLAIFALTVALAASASAQESAELVQTTGYAELHRASEAMIAPGGGKLSIRLPTTVRKGEVISIQYEYSGSAMTDSFMVTGISIKNGSCSLESKHRLAAGKELSDMIYARQCKKLQ